MPRRRANREIEDCQNTLALEREHHDITRQKLEAKCDELSEAKRCVAALCQQMTSASNAPVAEAENPQLDEDALEEVLRPPKGTRGLGKQLEECLGNNKILIVAVKSFREIQKRDKSRIMELEGLLAMPKPEDDWASISIQEKQSDRDFLNDSYPSVTSDLEMETMECKIFQHGEVVKTENINTRDLPSQYQALVQDYENFAKHDNRVAKKYKKLQEDYKSLEDTHLTLLSNYGRLYNSNAAERVRELESEISELKRTIAENEQETRETKEKKRVCDEMKRSLGGMRQQHKAEMKDYTIVKKTLDRVPFFADGQYAANIERFVESYSDLAANKNQGLEKKVEELEGKCTELEHELVETTKSLAVQEQRYKKDLEAYHVIIEAISKLPVFADEQYASKIDALVEMHTNLANDYNREKEAHTNLKLAFQKREELSAKK